MHESSKNNKRFYCSASNEQMVNVLPIVVQAPRAMYCVVVGSPAKLMRPQAQGWHVQHWCRWQLNYAALRMRCFSRMFHWPGEQRANPVLRVTVCKQVDYCFFLFFKRCIALHSRFVCQRQKAEGNCIVSAAFIHCVKIISLYSPVPNFNFTNKLVHLPSCDVMYYLLKWYFPEYINTAL